MSARHYDRTVLIPAPPEQVFAFVDDDSRLACHMSASSLMMGGGRMSVDVDETKGQAVGSHIRLSGRVFGMQLFLDEIVVRRDPPSIKVWETVGTPRLFVIGAYRMGIQITPAAGGSRLRVFIEYDFPTGWAMYCLGRLFGGMYARWCVAQMLSGASSHFARKATAAA